MGESNVYSDGCIVYFRKAEWVKKRLLRAKLTDLSGEVHLSGSGGSLSPSSGLQKGYSSRGHESRSEGLIGKTGRDSHKSGGQADNV